MRPAASIGYGLWRPRRRWALVIATVALLTSSTVATAAPSESLLEVTRTQAGRGLARAAAERFTAAGVPTSPEALVVFRVGPGDYLIGPSGLEMVEVGRSDLPRGRQRFHTVVAEPEANLAGLSVTRADDPTVQAAPYWTLVGNACFARVQRTTGWMDTCYHKHKLINDGDANYDYFELHMFATAKATLYPHSLEWAYVHAARNSGTMYWYDWDPRSDADRNCITVNVGVSVAGVSIGYNHLACEKWDITKYAEAGKFRNTWRKGWVRVNNQERETAFVIAVKSPQGTTPGWTFTWDFLTSCCA